jgi:hypothetical protein
VLVVKKTRTAKREATPGVKAMLKVEIGGDLVRPRWFRKPVR